MKATTILAAYVESRHAVHAASLAVEHTAMFAVDAEHRHAQRIRAWQRRTKQQARFLERLQSACREYDAAHKRGWA